MNKRLVRWYNRRIVAGWYRSWAIWVGVLAAAAPYAIDLLAYALDNWPTVGQYLKISDDAKEGVRIFLLVVVLPIARAWQQKTMQEAAAKQLAEKSK